MDCGCKGTRTGNPPNFNDRLEAEIGGGSTTATAAPALARRIAESDFPFLFVFLAAIGGLVVGSMMSSILESVRN